MQPDFSRVEREPYPGYDAEMGLWFALSCFRAAGFAPDVPLCPQAHDLDALRRWIELSGCGGSALGCWTLATDRLAERPVAEALTETYN
jgi:hypothetical protein